MVYFPRSQQAGAGHVVQVFFSLPSVVSPLPVSLFDNKITWGTNHIELSLCHKIIYSCCWKILNLSKLMWIFFDARWFEKFGSYMQLLEKWRKDFAPYRQIQAYQHQSCWVCACAVEISTNKTIYGVASCRNCYVVLGVNLQKVISW